MKSTTRVAASLAATALAGFAAVTPAFAAPGDPTPTSTATPNGTETPRPTTSLPATSAIDPAATGTLNIHKILGDPVANPTTTPQPTGAPASAMTPFEGAQFKIERVEGIDLTTAEGWQALAGITAQNLGTYTATEVATVVTDAAGLASWSGPIGVFRVTEIQKSGYTVAPAFLVTLPYTDDSGSWAYTRDVYPKNQLVQPNKQVDDTRATVGGTLRYTINAPVPAGSLTTFGITDPLTAALTVVAGSPVLTVSNGTALAQGTDYAIDTANNTVSVTFTASGLQKLQDARVVDPGLQVSVAFDATIGQVAAGTAITNTATIAIPNSGVLTTDTATGPTSTTFGDLTITKTDAGTTPLAGAVFQVYECRANAAAQGGYELLGDPLNLATTTTGTPSTTFTTAADGTARAYGLAESSFSGGSTGTVTNTYCAVETTAPSGYVKNPVPQVISYAGGQFTVTVQNQRDTILGQLPATGAFGIVGVFLVGGGLVVRGILAGRREDRDEDQA